jgi:hypothetical protein
MAMERETKHLKKHLLSVECLFFHFSNTYRLNFVPVIKAMFYDEICGCFMLYFAMFTYI